MLIIEASKILKALGNSKRLEILYCLKDDSLKVGQLEKMVKLSQSALSQHLAILRNAKIVSTQRDAQTIYYTISNEKVKKIMALLNTLF